MANHRLHSARAGYVIFIAFGLGPLILAPTAKAAWEAVPEISVTASRNDNILLDEANSNSSSRADVSASLELINQGEQGNFYIRPRVFSDTYFGSSPTIDEYGTTDLFLDAGGRYNGQRIRSQLRARYEERSLINSEFLDALPENPDLDLGEEFTDPDTGRLIFFDETRERFDLRGNFDVSLSERTQMRFELRQQDVSYTGPETSRRSDFDTTSLSIGATRQTSENSSLYVRALASRFQATRIDNTTDTVGIAATFTRPLSQIWTLDITAGMTDSSYDFLDNSLQRVSDSKTSPMLGLRFRRRAERTNWNIDLQHQVQPVGNGFVSSRDEIRSYVDRRFSERLSGRFGLVYIVTSSLGDVAVQDDRDYSTLDFSVEWAIKPRLFLVAGLNSRLQKFVNESGETESSEQIRIGIRYRGLSRLN
jgi:hypothetical protein